MAEPLSIFEQPELRDTAHWPAQGEWTWDAYLRLPDDSRRYEIIEGVLYTSSAPSVDHQFSVYELARRLGNFVIAQALGLVLGAPFDVRLPGISDPVQPDILFFRTGNEPKAGDKYFHGVPDLIVEVLSPGSVRLDQRIKFRAYEKAGVPEYWLVTPNARSITVYHLDAESRKYRELGCFGPDAAVRSVVLPGFETPVGSLFASPSR